MVISDLDNSTADGWATEVVLRDADRDSDGATKELNALWLAQPFRRTDDWAAYQVEYQNQVNDVELKMAALNYWFDLDESTGIISNNATLFNEGFTKMKAHYCLSEEFKVDYRLEVDHTLLLVVCMFCLMKCVLCTIVLATTGRIVPLITLGDAVESFIMKPDRTTAGMCTFGGDDFIRRKKGTSFQWLASPRSWASGRRRCGNAVPTSIWIWSYGLIGASLVVASTFCGIAVQNQAIGASSFSHGSKNKSVDQGPSQTTMRIALMANTPQLILSVCYLAYNGLFTRILSEFEWASFSLPYRWSIPLLCISIVLHWLYSNCIYVGVYDSYSWDVPQAPNTTMSLQYSTLAIVVSLCITLTAAVAPVALAFVKLPGQMVLAKNSSAAISAACHCIPRPSSDDTSSSHLDIPLLPIKGGMSAYVSDDDELLRQIALGKIRWGVIWKDDKEPSGYHGEGNPGHLAFGTMQQRVTDPVGGSYYAGAGLDGH